MSLLLLAMSVRVLAEIAASAPPPWVALAAGLGSVVAVSFRAALTTQVPPVWLTLRAPYRPALAVFCGAAAAFFTAVKGGEDWKSAAVAALGALAVSLPPVLFAEHGAAPPRPPPPPPPPAGAA